MTLVDIALLTAALAERDAAREENARLRAAVEAMNVAGPLGHIFGRKVGEATAVLMRQEIEVALAVPTADDGAERGAR